TGRPQCPQDHESGGSDSGRTAPALGHLAARTLQGMIDRVGIGTDVHRFDTDRPCWVAGLLWDGVAGLAGHSDGDVAARAACAAVRSAAGLGDLGGNCGTGRPEWAVAPGVAPLTETARRVRSSGFTVANVSIQVIGVAPRIGSR